MGKEQRKIIRKMKLCKNKQFVFDRDIYGIELEEITAWCEENLTGCFIWVDNKSWDIKVRTIGFQDQYDLLAFKLRWG